MNRRIKPQSTFQKISIAFLLLGVLPLILVCLLFLRRYEASADSTIRSNMEEANRFAQAKVEDLFGSVDRAMELLYDYSAADGSELWELLEDENLSDNERQLYVGLMLDRMLRSDPAVSAVHLIDAAGNTYSRYYSQRKSSLASLSDFHQLPAVDESRNRQLFILPAAPESGWCNNSSDTVLSLARNYMDIRSLSAAATRSLGVLYVDLNTEDLDGLLSSLRLGEQGNIAIVQGGTGEILYLLHPELEMPLLPQVLERQGGSCEDERFSVFYQPIGHSAYHLAVAFDRQELSAIHSATRLYLLLILAVTVAIILLLSIWFSGRISKPARKLQKAMQEVQGGNLSTRVDICSGDEMEYLGQGFNQMVEKLGDTIQEVYIAEICRQDAELNALKLQIQPHYLYNTLDVIRMNALEQGDSTTARLIESLSRQLRYVMGSHKDRVTLRQELDSLREYAILMDARYEGRIRLMMEAADSDLDLLMPKLLLQPFVENAVKHSLRDKPEGGTILIEVTRLERELQIMLFNDGIPIDPPRLEHIRRFLATAPVGQQDEAGVVSVGMKNTYDRIKLNCGREYGFTLDSSEGCGVVVTIRLPIWKEEEPPHEESTSG